MHDIILQENVIDPFVIITGYSSVRENLHRALYQRHVEMLEESTQVIFYLHIKRHRDVTGVICTYV